MATYVGIFGAPGVGKGTQAGELGLYLGVKHLATGDMFRANLKNKTRLGLQAQVYIDRGDLVPDGLTIDMLRVAMDQPEASGGVLLDGFPRNVVQVDALVKLLAERSAVMHKALYLRARRWVLVKRLSGRLVCGGDPQHTYHEELNPPTVPGICNVDGTALYRRKDDDPETWGHRIDVYLEQTMPVIEWYREAGILAEITGEGGILAVQKKLRRVFKIR